MSNKPPREIPKELLNVFTVNGSIPVIDHYIDDDVEYEPRNFSVTEIEDTLKHLQEGTFHHYIGQEVFLIPAVMNNVVNKDVLVIGSMSPNIECVCIKGNAKSVSTLEYNKIECTDERITTYTYDTLPEDIKFDVLISYSSFEHSGLGRYGDPLDPNGDLKAMAFCEKLLAPNGILILAVPLRPDDELHWNAHRIYGPIRWPMLISGWEVHQTYPIVDFVTYQGGTFQPIVILKKIQQEV